MDIGNCDRCLTRWVFHYNRLVHRARNNVYVYLPDRCHFPVVLRYIADCLCHVGDGMHRAAETSACALRGWLMCPTGMAHAVIACTRVLNLGPAPCSVQLNLHSFRLRACSHLFQWSDEFEYIFTFRPWDTRVTRAGPIWPSEPTRTEFGRNRTRRSEKIDELVCECDETTHH